MSSQQYDGYKVFRFVPSKKEDVNALLDLAEERNEGVIFLNQVGEAGQPVDIMVLPALQEKLVDAMKKRGVEAAIVATKSLKNERRNSVPPDNSSSSKPKNQLSAFPFAKTEIESDTIDAVEEVSLSASVPTTSIFDHQISVNNNNVHIHATISEFEFILPAERLVSRNTAPVNLMEKMIVPNHSAAEITANFSQSKTLEETIRLNFKESLSFLSSIEIVCDELPYKSTETLEFSLSKDMNENEDTEKYKAESKVRNSQKKNYISWKNGTVTHISDSLYFLENSVKIPAYKSVEIRAYINWLKRLELPFIAVMTLKENTSFPSPSEGAINNFRVDEGDNLADVMNTISKSNFIDTVIRILRVNNFKGKCIGSTSDGTGLQVKVSGLLEVDYGLETVFSVKDAKLNIGSMEEPGFKNGCVYQIVSQVDNKALELFAGDKADGAKVVTLDKNHRETQKWCAVEAASVFRIYSTLQEENNLKVLTHDLTLGKVCHSSFTEGDASQQWITQKVARNTYLIINCANEKCLTSQGHGISATAEPIRGPEESQLWKILPC